MSQAVQIQLPSHGSQLSTDIVDHHDEEFAFPLGSSARAGEDRARVFLAHCHKPEDYRQSLGTHRSPPILILGANAGAGIVGRIPSFGFTRFARSIRRERLSPLVTFFTVSARSRVPPVVIHGVYLAIDTRIRYTP